MADDRFEFPTEVCAMITAIGHPEGRRTVFTLAPEGWECSDGCSWWSEANLRQYLTGHMHCPAVTTEHPRFLNERCTVCGVNRLDNDMYGPYECSPGAHIPDYIRNMEPES